MATNITLRLPWHADGYNGKICSNPAANTYCVGPYSFPGDSIAVNKDSLWESQVAGKSCAKLELIPPCALSCNAFGDTTIKAFSKPPEWFNEKATAAVFSIPPATACTWPYELMYCDEVKAKQGGEAKYDNDKRVDLAIDYFKTLEIGKTLIVYYANYSNPFSLEDDKKYVIIGIARLKEIGELHYYENVSEEIKLKYAKGAAWQMPLTSSYPDKGFRIPYEKYMDNQEVLEQLLLVAENSRPFKYATRAINDDDLINIIERFIGVADTLISLDDNSENWATKKAWLISLLSELWVSRGAYPGLPQVLLHLGRNDLAREYLVKSASGESVSAYDMIIKKIHADSKLLRKIKLMGKGKDRLLLESLPRFNLTSEQISNLINTTEAFVTASVDEIVENPYLLCEQYVGTTPDDTITFYQIDNGLLPWPNYNIDSLTEADSAERFRALCVDALKWDSKHSFTPSERVLNLVNDRVKMMRDWRWKEFKGDQFTVDKDFLSSAMTYRNDEKSQLFLYLNEIYEDERIIRETLGNLVARPDIRLTRPVTEEQFVISLSANAGKLEHEQEYKNAIKNQAETCANLFRKPFCVISGSAGSGKTTLIKSIIEQIEKIDGRGAKVVLLAPTGKATERIREKLGLKSARTIHSLLAGNGWLNENFTFKRKGGKQETEVTTVIIDEASMIDLSLFATLIRAIKWSNVKRLILVGDPNQLPPIGRGKVFSDVIEWLAKLFPECLGHLKHNLRHLKSRIDSSGTGILDLAEILIQGKQSDADISKSFRETILLNIQEGGKVSNDLSVGYWNTYDDLKALIEQQLREDLAVEPSEGFNMAWRNCCKDKDHEYRMNPAFLQVLSPFRGEEFGTDNLNLFLQSLLNGGWANRCRLEGITYFDKVIQYVNHTKSNPIYAYNWDTRSGEAIEVFNGEMGFVSPKAYDNKKLKYIKRIKSFDVKFKGKEQYSVSYGDKPNSRPIDNLELAYAISVHKSQGSEFDIVYAVIPKKRSMLLSMELLYTAVTRAQKKLVLFLQEDVSSLASLAKVERSGVRRINSSVFEFKPLPERLSYLTAWYEEYKVISTLSEYFVRSKSEALIANALHMADLDFNYEKPLYANDGTMYLPDFTVIFRGEEFYWEHIGFKDLESYAAHWEKKKAWYEKHFPNRLLITEEGNDLSSQIKSVMQDIFEIFI
ncbi:MAG: ATP-dependent RecD-like DNA helicase [Deltaproteobacteria bacterium]|jgi:ATP-dependent exoDNAse (exonuclease V) alpha subunit|nr:ATP-dependent RecD-like DNA helicase [Deltaproteobacteria bacterium]